MKKSDRTKSIIISSVIELIEQTGSTEFTVGMIAQKADVAVGLINYHYESKQALIIDAVNSYVHEQIANSNLCSTNEETSPLETLVNSFISYADFLANHEVLSKLHIKYSLDGKIDADSEQQAINYYLPLLQRIGGMSDDHMIIVLRMISSTIQMTFLQTNIVSSNTFNFFDKEQRDRFIKTLIQVIFK